MKELLVRLIYVEMLGHNGEFGYIKAVELTASTNLLQKRVGYLTASLVLSPDHDFRFMMVNQLQVRNTATPTQHGQHGPNGKFKSPTGPPLTCLTFLPCLATPARYE